MIRQVDNHQGFTLIEVIVTIIVSSILAVLLTQVMKGHISRSIWPLEKMDEGLALHDVMDRITADYRRLLISDQQPLVALQNQINAGGAPGGYWFGLPYATSMQIVDSYCFDLDQTGESNAHQDCIHPADTLLKITLSNGAQSMTALFSR